MTRIEGLPEHLVNVPPAPDSPDDPLRDEKRAAFLAWRHEVLRYRVKRRIELENHPELRKFEKKYCANSPGYLAAIWHNVYEPRTEGKAGSGSIPFIPFAKQIDLWDEFTNVVLKSSDANADATLSKSRGWGGSWWGVELCVWGWMFSDEWHEPQPWSPIILSRKEEYVDSPKPKSLFWKIRELLRDTPDWLLPRGFDMSPKGPHMQRMYILNPENGNTMTGESTNADAGRGDRATFAMVDEPAAMDEGILDSIWSTLEGTTNHRLGIGTESFENSTAWWDLQHPKDKSMDAPYQMAADWWENPLNDDEWYAQKKKRFQNEPHKFEWEYLRNPMAGNQVPFVYPAARGIAINPDVVPKTGRATYITIDPSASDPTALVLAQANGIGGGIDFLASYSNQRLPAEFYAPLLKPALFDVVDKDWRDMHFIEWWSLGQEPQKFSYSTEEIEFAKMVDATGGKVIWVGDVHGDKTEGITADSIYGRWSIYGIHVNRDRLAVRDMGAYEKQARTHAGRQEAVRERLAKWRFGPHAELVLDALKEYRFQKNDKPTTTANRKPLHDNSSHIATACEYLAVYLRRKGSIDKREYAKPVRNKILGLSRGSRGLDRSLVRT